MQACCPFCISWRFRTCSSLVALLPQLKHAAAQNSQSTEPIVPCAQASIFDRLQSSCPFCIGRRPCSCSSLAALHPQLVSLEWHPERNAGLSPRDILPGSAKRVRLPCCNALHGKSVGNADLSPCDVLPGSAERVQLPVGSMPMWQSTAESARLCCWPVSARHPARLCQESALIYCYACHVAMPATPCQALPRRCPRLLPSKLCHVSARSIQGACAASSCCCSHACERSTQQMPSCTCILKEKADTVWHVARQVPLVQALLGGHRALPHQM